MSPTAKTLTKPTAAGVASDQQHGGNGENDALHLDELRSSDMNDVRMQCYAQKCIGPTNDGIDRICPIRIVARVIALRCSSAIVRGAAKSSSVLCQHRVCLIDSAGQGWPVSRSWMASRRKPARIAGFFMRWAFCRAELPPCNIKTFNAAR